MKKRVLAIILAMVMTVTMIPAMAFAADETGPAAAVTDESVTPSEAVFADKAYSVAEFEELRVYYDTVSYKDVKKCTIADTSIATVTHNTWNSYVTVKGVKRGQTTLTVTTTYGSVETYTINVTGAQFVFTDTPYNETMDRGDSDYVSVSSGFENYNWTVDDESVIQLEDYYSYGYKKRIKAVGKGEAMISVTNEHGDYTSIIITVTADEFTVDGKTNPVIALEVGDYSSLYLPYEYDWEDCTCVIENETVSHVEKDSLCYVYGDKAGDTVMVVTNQYGETVKCIIHVYEDLTKLSFTKDSYTVWMGKTFKLPYNIAPLNSNNNITFDVGYYDDIISISKDGVVTPLRTGTAYDVEIKSESYDYDECDIIVKAPYFNKKTYNLYKNQTEQIKFTGGRTDAVWTSSNKSVAVVSSTGKITAKKAGTAKITANSGGYKVTATVKVSNPKLSKQKATIWAGKTLKLKVTGAVGKVVWKSSNKKVATVNSSGKVTAKKAGTTIITAKVSGMTLKCKVTVKGPELSVKKKTLIAKQTYKLNVKGATKKVKWTSSNKSVATVSSSGKITAKKAGTATITAKVNGKSLKCKVTVKKNQVSYRVSMDVNQYDYGEPTVALKKAYWDGSKLKVDLYVINNRIFEAEEFDWLIYKLYDNNDKLIASQKFTNVKLNIRPGGIKKITLTFKSSAVKKKNAILNYGVSDYWSYWYYYNY